MNYFDELKRQRQQGADHTEAQGLQVSPEPAVPTNTFDRLAAERARERELSEKRTAGGQARAMGMAIPRAATSVAGGTMRGLAVNLGDPNRLDDNPLYRAGEAVDEFGRDRFSVPEEYEGQFLTDLAGGVGSMATFLATGGAGGLAGRGLARAGGGSAARQQTAQRAGQMTSAVGLAAPAGADEAFQRAMDGGQTPEQAQQLARVGGNVAGAVQVANINFLLRAFPKGTRDRAMSQLRNRILFDSASEATVEGAGALIQNAIEQSYNPDVGLLDGVAYQSLIGGLSSGVLQTGRAGLSRVGRSEGDEPSPEMQRRLDDIRRRVEALPEDQQADALAAEIAALSDQPQADMEAADPVPTMDEQMGALYDTGVDGAEVQTGLVPPPADDAAQQQPESDYRSVSQMRESLGLTSRSPEPSPVQPASTVQRIIDEQRQSREDTSRRRNQVAPYRSLAAQLEAEQRRGDGIDLARDDLLSVIAQEGGLDPSSLGGELDVQTLRRMQRVGRPVVRAQGQGRTLDHMAESLTELGFRGPDGAALDPNSLTELIESATRGDRIFAPDSGRESLIDPDGRIDMARLNRALQKMEAGRPLTPAQQAAVDELTDIQRGGDGSIFRQRQIEAAADMDPLQGEVPEWYGQLGELQADADEAMGLAAAISVAQDAEAGALDADEIAAHAEVQANWALNDYSEPGGQPLSDLDPLVVDWVSRAARAGASDADIMAALTGANGNRAAAIGGLMALTPGESYAGQDSESLGAIEWRYERDTGAQPAGPAADLPPVSAYSDGPDTDGSAADNAGGTVDAGARGPRRADPQPQQAPGAAPGVTSTFDRRGQVAREAADLGVDLDGLSPEQAEAIVQAFLRRSTDSVTGWIDARSGTIKQDMDADARAVVDGGDRVVFASIDIANLGGLNEFHNNVASRANEDFRAIADIVADELEAIGDTVNMRTGGDELGVFVLGDADAVNEALARANDRVIAYAQERGFADIPHAKGKTGRGVWLHFGTGEVRIGMRPGQIYDEVDSLMKAADGDNDGRTERTTARDRADEPQQPVSEGDAGPAVEAEPPGRAESPPVTPTEESPQTPAQAGVSASGDPIAAAAAAVDTSPSQAQIEAGNYRKGHVPIQGLDITIENPRGSTRSGIDPDGNRWETELAHHYGYIKRTEGADGEHVDVFIGPDIDSDAVFVIDQVNADGTFDEHKVMLGFRNQKAARDGYRANYERGWKVGPTTRMTMDEFKAWLAEGSTAEPVQPGQQSRGATKKVPRAAKQEAPAEKIEDFGEKLEGARKDEARKLRDAMSHDVRSVPLSKSWPEPDYQKLLNDGMDAWRVAAVRAMRDHIPTKPQKGYRLARWAEQVQELRGFASEILASDGAAASARKAIEAMSSMADMRGRIDLYMAVGHDISLKGIGFSAASYSFYEGQRYSPDRTIWEVQRNAKKTAFGNMPRRLVHADTKEEAIAKFKAMVEAGRLEKPGRQTRFDIYRYRSGEKAGQWIVGKKIGREYADLATFDTAAEARQYLADNQAELESRLARFKDIPEHRMQTNSPRVGEDHRNGQDVTPELFAETFGFRGVQFGNYVEQGRRQQDLNEAFDALMDMAGILNLPPQALSLGGELGLAFGARGKGGKRAAKAHYESDQIVINLTKKDGAGSLAHEWWHALDNYFTRERGAASDRSFATEGAAHVSVRPAVAAAFREVIRTINNTRIRERSRMLDRAATKAYWSTGREMSARAFESYVIERLRDQGASNDYLANVVSQDYWNAAAALGLEKEGSYPYPEAAEIPVIRSSFDQFFQTVETRQDGDSTVLFSMAPEPGSPERAEWGDFPPVIRNGDLGQLNKFEGYEAAKAGDAQAALDLVESIISDDFIEAMREAIGDQRPIVVPVISEEVSGRNKIPGMFAEVLADRLGLDVSGDIVQVRKASRTGQGAYHRLAYSPGFDGPVQEGQPYLIVDDTLTMGGTLASLRGFIENRGGRVIRAAVLTAHEGALSIPVTEKMLRRVRAKHGDALEQYWQSEFGYGLDQTTQGEAGHLRAAPDVDAIRDRIAEARRAASEQLGETGAGAPPASPRTRDSITPQSPTEARPSAGLSASGLRAELRKTLGQRLADSVDVVQSLSDMGGRSGLDSLAGTADPVTSPAFRRWFGDSKVVQADGSPQVVYHGTATDFSEFAAGDPNTEGGFELSAQGVQAFFFTPDPAVAAEYAEGVVDSSRTAGDTVMPVYLSLQNPLIIEADGAGWTQFQEQIAAASRDGTADGVILRNVEDGMFEGTIGEVYIAFRPEQIKSAIGNRGTFDPASPDILDSRAAGRVEGMFNPETGKIVLVADNIASPERGAWVAWHELFHRGLRASGRDSSKPLAAEAHQYRQALNRAGLNRTVRDLADAIIADRRMAADQRLLATEEALAELNAADETGDYQAITDRYGVQVPMGVRQGIAGHVARFVDAVRGLINRMFGRGAADTTDAEVWRIIVGARAGYAADWSPSPGQPLFSMSEDGKPDTDAARRQRSFMQGIGSQPIDRMFRLPFDALRLLDSHGRFKGGVVISDAAKRALTEWKPNPEGRFGWMNPMLEKARAGLIDRYGLSDEYRGRWRQTEAEIRRRLGEALDLFEGSLGSLSVGEARVLQAVLTGEQVPDAEWSALAEPIRRAIDDMGREAVNLGLISPEAYERNRGSYLHRSYLRHEGQFTGLSGWVHQLGNKRRRNIQGDALKRRGMDARVTMADIKKATPAEWWKTRMESGRADASLIGSKFIVLERLAPIGEGTATMDGMEEGGPRRRRVMERHYWPADREMPAKYDAWEQRGTWEVRDVRGDRLTLWRDHTKAERQKMGEILDARYNIVKTFETLSHDIAMGRFFSDIAQNPEWFQREAPPDGPDGAPVIVDANRARMLETFAGVDWVKVPETRVGSGDGAFRWGALAGGHVRAEVWRDLNELDKMQVTGTWRPILNQWKLNKTARSPVVHMNNVMSNFMLMDLADVRVTDFVRGFQAMVRNAPEYREAMELGAFEASFINQEIRTRILEPVLQEVMEENLKGPGSPAKTLSILSKVAYGLHRRLTAADRKMIQYYQLEDEVFRMATYMRRLDLGDSPAEAAAMAREQFLDYDIRAPWVNAARRTVLPFISYTYRAVPVVAQSIAHRPWKLAKYFTIAYLMQALAYELAPGDQEEEQRTLRQEEQGYTWIGVPRKLRMPYRDGNDNPVFLDIRRWIPAGDVFDMNQGQSAVPIPAPLQLGGPLMLGFELALNKQAFTGQEIVDPDTDTAWDITRNVGDWAWKSWMPSAAWVPGSHYWTRLWTAGEGGRDMLGRPYSVPQAAASSVGIKLQPHDVQLGYYYRSGDLRRRQQALRSQARRLSIDLERGLIQRSKYDREIERVQEKMRRVEAEARRLQGRE